MQEMGGLLEQWRIDEAEVRRRMYRAPTPPSIGQWAKAFAEGGPKALGFEQSGGSLPSWTWTNEGS